MVFKVGDIITGLKNNCYGFTTERALMLVTDCYSIGDMKVLILYHNSYIDQIDHSYDVSNSDNLFTYTTFEEFEGKYPDCYKMDMFELGEILSKYNVNLEKKQVEVEENPYELSDEMRRELLDEMSSLLRTYRYDPQEEGLNRILDEWCKNKANLIRLFEKHPNYNGKFQIAFDFDYEREFDSDKAYEFCMWLKSNEVKSMFLEEVKIGELSYKEISESRERINSYLNVFDYHNSIETINGKSKQEYFDEYMTLGALRENYRYADNVSLSGNNAYKRDLYDTLTRINSLRSMISNIIDSSKHFKQFVDESTIDEFNYYFPEAKIKENQKMSRAINKILCMLGVDKAPNYNKEFAKFSDAINPLKIKRHTVISIHPVDYYTMSFGNSWSSCHTIDKENDRGIDGSNGWRGAHSSGTESYMLDKTSCVFYTVDGSYDGNQLELENKINRCMFHYNDNRLVQGRVYPQSNDSGSNSLYQDIREIAQKVFADVLEVPNYWINKKGVSSCCEAIRSRGTHYRDYANFNNCNISTLKDDRCDHKVIEIGHDPICPSCGEEHSDHEHIECYDCRG